MDRVKRVLDDGTMLTSTDHRPATAPPSDGATSPRDGDTNLVHDTPLVEARDLTRIWGTGRSAHVGVRDVDLRVAPGELVAVVGPSGSGKSTLGALIAGIDTPTAGSLVVAGERIDQLSTDRLARWRGRNVGIVFQDFHLLPTLSAQENVELAVELGLPDASRRARRTAAAAALASVGLFDHARRLPSQLSGGEQQRVGVARALVNRPALVVADEPTGALDQASGRVVFDLLVAAAGSGTTVIFITHDTALAERAQRIVSMVDGDIESIIELHGQRIAR
jgi:putative ABC transport system ATP-binding protein